MCDTGHSHSRESSVSVASSDSNTSTGLVLSVSALTKRGPGSGSGASSGCKDSPRSEVEDDSGLVDSVSVASSDVTMGQTQGQEHNNSDNSIDNMVRLEPEGINEEDSQNFTSFLSVDKRLFGRLQEELTQAQSELKLKEEQVVKLSRIRDDVEREMEDLTASLFQVKQISWEL